MKPAVLFAASALALSSGSALAASSPISAQLIGIKDVSIGFSGATFTLRSSLTRTRGLPIVVKDVHYELRVNGEVIGQGEQAENLRLRRNKPAELLIPSQLSPRGGIVALGQMMSDPSLEIAIVGEASGRWLFFSRTERFREVVSTEELLSSFMPR
ncbi:MAG: hypothetical protein ACI8S6_003333 [Myxococcota bacterium]|jgi:hypothetical protein